MAEVCQAAPVFIGAVTHVSGKDPEKQDCAAFRQYARPPCREGKRPQGKTSGQQPFRPQHPAAVGPEKAGLPLKKF